MEAHIPRLLCCGAHPDGSKSAGDLSESGVLLSFSHSHTDGWLLYTNTTWHLSESQDLPVVW